LINLIYPISLENLNKLKNGDKILYTGKVIFVTPQALERLLNYYNLEGIPLFNFLGEFVTYGTFNWAHNEIKNITISKISNYVDFIFSAGANSLIVDKLSAKALQQLQYYKRPILKTISKTIKCEQSKILFYKDIKNGGIIECWIKNQPMEVLTFDEQSKVQNINNA